ncbi:MAG: helix-turn-helix transcriptional regulator [Caulobacteraceae bacterium]
MDAKPKDYRANFLRWMEEAGATVAEISRRTAIPSSTLYSFTRGQTASLKDDVLARIAEAYSTTADAVIGGAASRRVQIVGRIGARAEVRPFDEDPEAMYEVPLPQSLEGAEDYVAFEIEGFSMPPARPGWIVVFRKKQTPIQDLVGYPCLIDLANGQRLFKELHRGYTPGLWNLASWDGSPLMEDQTVIAALPFVALSPGRMGR